MTAHINNQDMHITPSERTKWNASLDDSKSYTDGKVGPDVLGLSKTKSVAT